MCAKSYPVLCTVYLGDYVEGCLGLEFFHVVGHEIMDFQASSPGIIYLYQRDVARASILWLW